MKLRTIDHSTHVRTRTKELISQLLSPLCGLNTHINFIGHEKSEPNLLTAGAELTGVYVLQGLATKHRPGAHHIGGSGTYLNEVLIKIAGESIERYSQLVSEMNKKHEMVFASYQEMQNQQEPILSHDKLKFFSEEQVTKVGFPFQNFSEDAPLSWVRTYSITHARTMWVPAQLLLVGYNVKRKLGEPWLFSAVTTGTAAHTHTTDAFRNALLELVQLDSAMGHWYTHTEALLVKMDTRTKAIANFIKHTMPAQATLPQFFWLKNADLTDFTIACVFRNKSVPRVAVGLGSDTRLVHAIHKAYLEAIGVASLAKLVLVDNKISNQLNETKDIFDLDSNVALYGKGGHHQLFCEKFNSRQVIAASHMPADVSRTNQADLKYLINQFISTGKELLFLDLTTAEAKELGFTVSRVWSPDTLSLCLPSAVPIEHARFQDYGGVAHVVPHPYP